MPVAGPFSVRRGGDPELATPVGSHAARLPLPGPARPNLPFVPSPEYDDFLEKDGFYERSSETYVPLLEMMDGLEPTRGSIGG